MGLVRKRERERGRGRGRVIPRSVPNELKDFDLLLSKGSKLYYRLTHVTSLVVYLQLPVAMRGFAPGVHRHEGPLIEARA